MRILLATAVAIAPLMAASGALAEVVISTARTTPITTANATGSGPDAIRIASGGSIAVNTGAAVTVNSSHGVDIDSGGSITMALATNGATGILVNGGNTANITVGGSISITDDIVADTDRDTDNDGDDDGAFANGTGRHGIHLAGGAPLTGNIVVESGGSVIVEGNESYGIRLEAPLTGNLDVLGSVSVTGNNSYGLRTTGTVSGDVRLVGTISAQGENTVGASIEGDVTGQFLVESAIMTTGYRYTTSPPVRPEDYVEPSDDDDDIRLVDELDADDLLQGGPALNIAANIAGGVLLDAAPAYRLGIEGDDDGDAVKNGDEDDDGDGTKNRDDTDRDGDGLLDANEQTATLTSFGSAPALVVGSETRAITIGAGDEDYGLINRGSITAVGVYGPMTLENGVVLPGVSATAVQIGVGQSTTLVGGFHNEGTISATARGESTGVLFGSGAVAPAFVNDGGVSVVGATEEDLDATGVLINAGATVNEFINNGTMSVSLGGEAGDAVGIRDLSGSLTSIQNTGAIAAGITPTDDADDADDANTDAGDETVTGSAIAIDVRANTTGVNLVQLGLSDGDDDGDAATVDQDTDGDGVDDGDEPVIVGDILLGSGADTVDIRNGAVVGDIAFGDGADSLAITGGATVVGVLSDTDGALSIDVADGTLDSRQTTALNVTDLNIGAEGDLLVTIDPASGTTGGFNVAGTATLADGAGLGVRFNSLLAAPETFVLIDAATLNAGDIDLDGIQDNSPYLYVVQGGVDAAAGQVFADVRRRTADEAGLIPVEASMYEAFYEALGDDDASAIRNAFLGQTGRDDFINLYEQLLPDHSGGPLMSLASGVDAVTRALTGRNASAAPGETSAWVQEINFYADKDKTDTYGFRSEGFGVAGGVERGTGLGAVGLTAAFTSSDLTDPEAEAEEVLSANLLELGLYWRAQGQHWTTWARAAAGYATFESERRFVGAGLNLSNQSDWNGITLAAAGGVSYERNFGRFSIRPEAYAEYFSLSEDGHVEEGGGDGFDLEIDDREGHLFSATAAVNIGMAMGDNSWLRPELRVGWRQNISVDPGETIARFRSGGPDFILSPDTIEGGGPIVGLRVNIGNELGMLSINADAEMIDDYVRYMLFLRASFRF